MKCFDHKGNPVHESKVIDVFECGYIIIENSTDAHIMKRIADKTGEWYNLYDMCSDKLEVKTGIYARKRGDAFAWIAPLLG